MLFSSVGTLILYTSWAGARFGWAAPEALALLGMSGALAVAFIYEERRAPEPILELSLLVRRSVWPPLLATCIFGFANFAMAFFIPLFGLVVRGDDPVRAGFALAPLTAGLLFSGIVFGRRSAATGRYRRYASLGLIIYLVGLAFLVTADGNTPLPAFLFYNLLLGMGSGALSPVVVTSIQNAVEERYLGVASSLPGFSRAVAQTIGTSMLGSLLALRISTHIRRAVSPIAPAGVDIESLTKSPETIHNFGDPLRAAAVEAYRAAFSETFLVMMAVMTLALIATRFMRDPVTSDPSR